MLGGKDQKEMNKSPYSDILWKREKKRGDTASKRIAKFGQTCSKVSPPPLDRVAAVELLYLS